MSTSSVIYLCINLPWAEERRGSITAQAQRLGLNVQFVEAIAGRDLTSDVPEYDKKKRSKAYTYDLSRNEQACMLSHIKALKTFLASDAEYAVIMEDDAMMADNIDAGVHELIDHLQGWETAKLYTDDGGKLYPLGDKGNVGSNLRAVFPKKLVWVLVGWLWTRTGAEKLLAELGSFSLLADMQIGHIILQKQIPTIGVTPSLITTSDPNNESSTIDTAATPRTLGGDRRTFMQYLRYRFSVWSIAWLKIRMRRMLRRRLRRV